MSRDEAFLIAVNIAKLPSVPRQILKDIRGRRTRPAGMIDGHKHVWARHLQADLSRLERMRWDLISSWWSKPLKEMKLATFNAREV